MDAGIEIISGLLLLLSNVQRVDIVCERTVSFFFVSSKIINVIINNHRDNNIMRAAMTNVSTTAVSLERKTQILRVTLGLTVVSFLTFLITLTSSKWVAITYPSDFLSKRQGMFISESTYGIIWECLVGRPITSTTNRKYHASVNTELLNRINDN